MTLIVFVLILSALVLIHEFGHFIFAKKNGVRVEEFGWGLPPRLWGKKFGDTLYSINWLPLGGFVKLSGEDSSETAESTEEGAVFAPDPKSFATKTLFQRFQILIAGVVMNFLLAFVVFYVVLAVRGFVTPQMPLIFDYQFKFGTEHLINTVIIDTQKDAAADRAGIVPGDVLVSIDNVPVQNETDIRRLIGGSEGKQVTLKLFNIQDETSHKTVQVTPEPNEQFGYALGVYLGTSVSLSYDTLGQRLLSGPLHSYNVMDYSLSALSKLIAMSFETRDLAPVSASVAGPVGMYNVVGSILKLAGPDVWLVLLDFVGLMSLSLGFMNVLPFPALDGGRIVFLVIEGVTRRKVNPKLESAVHGIGMIVLLLFIAVVTLKDFFL